MIQKMSYSVDANGIKQLGPFTKNNALLKLWDVGSVGEPYVVKEFYISRPVLHYKKVAQKGNIDEIRKRNSKLNEIQLLEGLKGEVFLFCKDNRQKKMELFLIEDPRTKPIIYSIGEGGTLYSRVHDANDFGEPRMAKVRDEMRVCAFTDLQSIYVHYLEKDKLLLKMSQTGIPLLLTCLPSSDKTSLEITYLTDMNEDGTIGDGKGKEVFIRETVSLENWDQ